MEPLHFQKSNSTKYQWILSAKSWIIFCPILSTDWAQPEKYIYTANTTYCLCSFSSSPYLMSNCSQKGKMFTSVTSLEGDFWHTYINLYFNPLETRILSTAIANSIIRNVKVVGNADNAFTNKEAGTPTNGSKKPLTETLRQYSPAVLLPVFCHSRKAKLWRQLRYDVASQDIIYHSNTTVSPWPEGQVKVVCQTAWCWCQSLRRGCASGLPFSSTEVTNRSQRGCISVPLMYWFGFVWPSTNEPGSKNGPSPSQLTFASFFLTGQLQTLPLSKSLIKLFFILQEKVKGILYYSLIMKS